MKRIITHIAVFSLILLAVSCAHVQAPSGGPPDTTPPVILVAEPENSALNFEDDRIKLKFSKHMNKTSVIENFYILPTSKVSFDWSGKDLYVEFDEPLRENTTYSVNLGADYTDLKGNKPEDAFNLIFSTGSVIDSGKISGRILTERPQGLFVFGYNLSRISPDTLNPAITAPDYKVQIGVSGNFVINGLPDGQYRLYAVLDQFKDGMISDGQDKYACSYTDADVKFGKSSDVFFRFGTNVDFSGPKLFSAEAASNRKIKAFFSETLDSSSISLGSFTISDSISNESYELQSAVIDFEAKNVVNLISSIELPPARRFILSINPENVTIKDTVGNKFISDSVLVRFLSSKERDSSLFTLKGQSIKDSASNVSINSYPRFIFSESIDSVSAKFIQIKNLSDTTELQFQAEIFNESSLIIKPIKPFNYNSNYLISLRAEAVSPKFGIKSIDSTIHLKFTTEDNRSNGSLSGKIEDASGTSARKIIVLSGSSGMTYQIIPKADGKWEIDNIKPGTYTAWLYEDSNNNERYDYGRIFPFEFAEKFFLTEQEVNAKSRWALEGIVFKIGK